MYILKKETSNVCCHRHTNTSNVGLLTLNSTDREEGGSPILTLTKIFEKGLTNQKTKDMKGQKLKRLFFRCKKTKTIRKRPQKRRGFPAEACVTLSNSVCIVIQTELYHYPNRVTKIYKKWEILTPRTCDSFCCSCETKKNGLTQYPTTLYPHSTG